MIILDKELQAELERNRERHVCYICNLHELVCRCKRVDFYEAGVTWK